MSQPLMPMATAVWLVDNTSLSFRQIAEFCGLHVLEVQGIADETVAVNMVGQDPIANGQLTMQEIERCQADASTSLQILTHDVEAVARTKGPRYTPVSKRQDKPDAIAWLVRYHPELSDLQISRLVGTTKPTIKAIRERTHWNMANIRSQDPVGLGLCRQSELDEAVKKAAAKKQKEEGISAEEAGEAVVADTAEAAAPALNPVDPAIMAPAEIPVAEAEPTAESVFGKSPASDN